MKKITTIVSALLFCILCYGDDLRFNKLTSKEGLSESEITTFLKDSHGFMWIGSLDGLNRFDGYNIEKFNVNQKNANSLSNNTIRALAEDNYGRIWVGTDDGLNVLLPDNQQFSSVKIPKSNSSFTIIYSLYINNNNIWIGTENGLFKANIASEDIQSIEKSIVEELVSIRKQSKNTKINRVLISSVGDIWIGGFGRTVCYKCDKNKNILHLKQLPDYITTKSTQYFVEDINKNIWLGIYNEGLVRFNPKTGIYTTFKTNSSQNSISSNSISGIAIDKEGNIWICTPDKGLNKINYKETQKDNINFVRYQNNIFNNKTLNSNLILAAYTSQNNNLWIGTIGSGVNFAEIHQKKFNHYTIPPLNNETSISTNFIRSVYLDNHNNLWIGTHNNGLFKLNRENGKFYKFGPFESLAIFYIYSLDNKNVIVCTLKGLYIVNENGNVKKVIGIDGNSFYATSSKPNIYWIANSNGIYRIEIANDKIISINNYNATSTSIKISLNNCRTVVYDDFSNELWVGTEGGGLNIITLDKNHFPIKTIVFKKTNNLNTLSNNYVRSIYKQNNNIFWVGTYEGLIKIERNNQTKAMKFTSFFKEDGLPNNLIQSITEDNNQNLWIGSNGGLTRFNTKNLKITNYDITDGLQSNEFSEHTCYRAKNGELFFGGINGVTSFFPNTINESLVQPQITITDLYLFNEKVQPQTKIGKEILLEKPIYLTKKLTLKPNQNNIRFDFSAMIFTTPQKIKYAYKLEGYDKNWIITDAQNRNATYTSLPYGNYKFLVKATNGDGVWCEKVSSIDIHIKTPFYLTWFAFLLYFIASGLIIFYFTRYSIIKITTKKQIELDLEHNQKLLDLDAIRTRFFINISHDLRTPLTLIIGPLEQIIRDTNIPDKFKNKINVVHKNANKLKYLIEQLLDFRKNEVGKLKVSLSKVDFNEFVKQEVEYFEFTVKEKGLELSYNFKFENFELYLDKEKTAKIIFNLLSNAIKFTNNGFIDISVEKGTLSDDSSNLYAKIIIRDTGIGIDKEKVEHVFERFYNDSKFTNDSSYGIGLSHCKDLIEVMNGQIKVESEFGSGSTFTVYLPLIEYLEGDEILETTLSKNTIQNKQSIEQHSSIENSKLPKANTVLISEDNKDMREYIKSCLEDNYNIIETENGSVAYNLAIRKLPDLIISDIVMPIMDGITLCEKIKSTIDTSHIPVILLTARTDNEIKFKGLEIGADDYISKPFDIDYLNIKVRNLISGRENLRNLFKNNVSLEPSKVTVTSIDEKFLIALLSKIEKGIPNPEFTIETLEKDMNMSHSKFYRKVKSLTGQSGKELLQDMRLKRAAQIINDNQKVSVADLTELVGFSDPKHFSSCFKQKFGVPPSEY